MSNNRIIYATASLNIKDNQADSTTLIMGILKDAKIGSNITSGFTGAHNLIGSVSGTWPTAGQFKVKNTLGLIEYIRYTGFSSPSGIVITARGTGGTVASAHLKNDRVRLTGWEVPFGVQSVSFGTTFNLEDVFHLGQLDAYENVEGIPEVEVSIERVLDGTKPLWLMVADPEGTTLKEKTAKYKVDVALNVYPDVQDSAHGTPDSTCTGSGLVVSAWSVTLPTDGNFTESLTLVGNDKSWGEEEGIPSGIFAKSDCYDARVVGSGVERSEDFDKVNSTLPADVPTFDHIQSVGVSVDITREDIFELGRKTPFFRSVAFPVTVTTTIEAITDKGDLVNAKGDGSSNLVDRTILIKTKGGLKVDLGSKNKLSSVQFQGFDAGGGNGTTTFEYQNSNRLTITHDNFLDPFKTNVDLDGFALC